MNILLWLLIPVGLALAGGLSLSFYLTRRQPLTAIHSPAEYRLDFEEIAFNATDGVTLRDWWIPAPNSERAVVILHGHGGSMDYDIHRAPAPCDAGFNVLLFDFRAHGRSQGNLATFGYLELRDVLGAVEFLKSRGIRRIGLLGFSYGGMASILAASNCPEVNALITDGGPARMRTAITARGIELHLPRLLAAFLAWLAILITSLRLGVNLFRYEPVRWVGWDGSGYPQGLSGKNIPIEGRILALSDVFDALTTTRPYHPARPKEEVISFLQYNAGKQFDPELAPAFIQIVRDQLA